MTQLSQPADPIVEQSDDFLVEHRRLGFWVVASGSHLYTVTFGHNPVTMDFRCRVTWGASFEDFPNFDAAIHFCRYAHRPRRRPR